jgi:hypothetical protein
MSHITRVKTLLKDLNLIKKVLSELGVDFVEGTQLRVLEAELPVEVVIRLPDSRHPIALVLNEDSSYSLSGQQNVMSSLACQELVAKLKQRYAYHIVKDRLAQQGFQLETETAGEEGRIHMTLRRTN